MSLNLNKVILAGRLTAKPELKATPSGLSVTSFNLAVDRKVAKDAEKKTDFIGVVAWRQTAEFICKFFDKGSAICITGNIQTRTYEDKDKKKVYVTEVIAEEANFVESKGTQGTTQSASQTTENANFVEVKEDEDLPF